MIKINGVLVKRLTFPGGEVNIQLPAVIKPPFKVHAWLQSSDDIMSLLLVQDALKRHHDQGIKHLVMPYLPYARQDRVCNVGEALSRQVFIDVVMPYVNPATIKVYHPHSDGLPHAWEVVPLYALFKDTLLTKNSVLVIPDKGAIEDVTAVALYNNLEFIQGTKTREVTTGKLSGFDCDFRGVDCKDKDLWILDDICDGGGTFLGLLEILKTKNPRTVNLYTTHGIYSKGLDVLCSNFDRVVSTNTYMHDLPHKPTNYTMLEILDV